MGVVEVQKRVYGRSVYSGGTGDIIRRIPTTMFTVVGVQNPLFSIKKRVSRLPIFLGPRSSRHEGDSEIHLRKERRRIEDHYRSVGTTRNRTET